jgi:hypothetical protein
MRALERDHWVWTMLALVWLAGCGRQPDQGQAILAAYDEIASASLWPGFVPDSVPLAVFDGATTYLIRHPDPPAEFAPVADRPGLWSYAGQHEAVRANMSTEIAGAHTATLLTGSDTTVSHAALAATLVHEAFHVYQRQNHPDWQANEVELFVYPVEDVELLELRYLETEALRRALSAGDGATRACWSRGALALRWRCGTQGRALREHGGRLDRLRAWLGAVRRHSPLYPESGDGRRSRRSIRGPDLRGG